MIHCILINSTILPVYFFWWQMIPLKHILCVVSITWIKTQWCISSVVSPVINVNVTPQSTLITFILFSQQYASIRRQNTWLAGSSDSTKIQYCTLSEPLLKENKWSVFQIHFVNQYQLTFSQCFNLGSVRLQVLKNASDYWHIIIFMMNGIVTRSKKKLCEQTSQVWTNICELWGHMENCHPHFSELFQIQKCMYFDHVLWFSKFTNTRWKFTTRHELWCFSNQRWN